MPAEKPNLAAQNTPIKLTDRTEDVWENSEAAKALERMRQNPRIKYIVICVRRSAAPAVSRKTAPGFPRVSSVCSN